MCYIARGNTKVPAWRRSTLRKVQQDCFRTEHLPVYRHWIWYCYRYIALFAFPCIKHVMNHDRKHNNVWQDRARTKEQKNSNMEWTEKPLRVNVLKVFYVIDEGCQKKFTYYFFGEKMHADVGTIDALGVCLLTRHVETRPQILWNKKINCKKKAQSWACYRVLLLHCLLWQENLVRKNTRWLYWRNRVQVRTRSNQRH